MRHVVQAADAFKLARDYLLIDQMGVAEGHRRKGVGRALMAEARRIAREGGATRLELDVYALNADARAFYASEGFTGFREQMEAGVGPNDLR